MKAPDEKESGAPFSNAGQGSTIHISPNVQHPPGDHVKPPAFQFYPDDFIGGTVDLTPHEVGCYIRLLCHQWNRGSIPAEPDRLKIIAGGEVSEHVRTKFPKCPDGQCRNERLEKERQKQSDFREKQRQNGLASGRARRKSSELRLNDGSTKPQPKLNGGSTVVQPSMEPKPNSLSPSSYSTKTTKLKKLSPAQKELAEKAESLLGKQWVNDAGKWINRIKSNFKKSESVIGELNSAISENRIKTTPAQYAEQIWKEFA